MNITKYSNNSFEKELNMKILTLRQGFLSLILLIMFVSANAKQAQVQVPGPLVDSSWLKANLDKVIVLDVRKDLKSFTTKGKKKKTIAGMQSCGAKKGSGIKVSGHIPGAVLVNWKKVRAKREIDGRQVKKLIPAKADFEAFMQAHGVNNDSAIVIVSKGTGSKDMTFATRLYWQLKYYGYDNMAVLNGGTARWAADGNDLSYDASKPSKGNFTASTERKELLASASDVQAAMKAGNQLIDARTEDYYLGTEQKDYVYAKGHISGAKNFPHPLIVEGKVAANFLSKSQLSGLFKAKGIDPSAPSVTYCDSGHLSTGQWFLMHEVMGNKDVKLYDGSMHDWTQNKAHAVTAMKME